MYLGSRCADSLAATWSDTRSYAESSPLTTAMMKPPSSSCTLEGVHERRTFSPEVELYLRADPRPPRKSGGTCEAEASCVSRSTLGPTLTGWTLWHRIDGDRSCRPKDYAIYTGRPQRPPRHRSVGRHRR